MTNSGAIQRAEGRRATRKAFNGWKKGSGPTYTKLVHVIFQSEQYAMLAPREVKLLVDLMAQYRGVNNGDLSTAWRVMKPRGWRSKDQVWKAERGLERRGWIWKTRQGGRRIASLWALTFFGINDCRDKHGNPKRDAGVKPDTMPLHLWKRPEYSVQEKSLCPVRRVKLAPCGGSIAPPTPLQTPPTSPPLPRVEGL